MMRMWQAIKCFFGYHNWAEMESEDWGPRIGCVSCLKWADTLDEPCEHDWQRILVDENPCQDFDMCSRCGETREAVINSRHEWERVTNIPGQDGHLSVRCRKCDLATHWDRVTQEIKR